ncbi:hypothetical protein ACWERY_10570 [Streptomyces sp. NPDC004082]|uniref:hypothetical protein n=1 Tax=unclassified Streptomyces TaxID=2593676 RepID=UPI0033B9C7E8
MDCSDVDGCHSYMEFLQKLGGRAYAEVQRADTKATTVCGVAGGLLALSVAALTQKIGIPLGAVFVLVVSCLLLAAAVGVALLALRPVLPMRGLRRVLTEGSCGHGGCGSGASGPLASTVVRWEREDLRLQALSHVADRKFRLVRAAGDLVLVALLVAGMGLLSCCAFN